jgi:hypothetical protein
VVVLITAIFAVSAVDKRFFPRATAPALVVAPPTCDLGSMVPGERVERVVTLRNTGSQALVIRHVRPSNRRVAAHLSVSSLSPGNKSELRIEFSSDVWEEGDIAEQVLIYSNDGDAPLTKVMIRGRLQSPITWAPKVLLLGLWGRHDTKPLPVVRFRSADGHPIGPLRVSSFVPFVEVKTEQEKPGVYTIQPRLDPAVPTGPLLGWLKVETGHPKLPVVALPIRSQVAGDLLARPSRLDFGIVEEAFPATAAILLTNRGDRNVRVLKVEKHLTTAADVSVSPKGKDWEIKVRVSSPSPWKLDGHLNVYTDHPDEPVVQVPVEGWVRPKRPFDHLAASGTDVGLSGLLEAALFRIGKIPAQDIATKILGSERSDRSVSLLLHALEADSWAIRARAAETLGLLESSPALEPVRRAVTDDIDEEVRRSAARALVKIAGKTALPELLLALQDNDSWVRQQAAMLLGELGDSRAIPALTRALADEKPMVRDAVNEALKLCSVALGSTSGSHPN